MPVHDDQHLFDAELEGAQAGLSWLTVLKKRANYKRLFDDFDARKIARYDARKKKALLKDEGIIRNRLKVDAVVANAKAFLAVQEEFGSFDRYIWGFVGGKPVARSQRRRERSQPARPAGNLPAVASVRGRHHLPRLHARRSDGERPRSEVFARDLLGGRLVRAGRGRLVPMLEPVEDDGVLLLD